VAFALPLPLLPFVRARFSSSSSCMQNSDNSRIPWRIVTAVWMLPTIADVADTYIARRVSGHPGELWRMAAIIAPGWLVWIFFTPVIFWLGARIRLVGPTRAWRLVAHFALSIIAGLVHAAVVAACMRLFDQHVPVGIAAHYAEVVSNWLPVSMLLYWLTLGAGYALEGARRERAQALRTTELEGQLARSELAVLRAQLQPHFLFNALNTAVSLVRAREPEAGVHVLTHLSELLRQLVTGVEQELPLREELRLLDSYLEIERARFGSRLTIIVDVPPALLDAYVPGLVLQPLVENALRHGVGKRDAQGHVWINARARGATQLELRVRDDGPGLARDVLDARGDIRTGVGIGNTRARLSRLYGTAGTLELRDREGGGAETIVMLPLRNSPVHAGATSIAAAR
jgi:two-component system, LytTR family, sensor kinase